jgi:hypothetical protein
MPSTKLAEPEPAQLSPDRQPASTVAPSSTPPLPVDSPAKAERPIRVVLYQQHPNVFVDAARSWGRLMRLGVRQCL